MHLFEQLATSPQLSNYMILLIHGGKKQDLWSKETGWWNDPKVISTGLQLNKCSKMTETLQMDNDCS